MKLWSGVLSPFSAKVRIALAEKGLPFEILEIPWSRQTLWGPKPEEFLAVSPRGQVPALVDGELGVFDSTIIVEYLEDRYPAPPLMPKDAADRARCRMWEELADAALAGAVVTLIRERFLKPDPAAGDREAIAAAEAALCTLHTRLDTHLGTAGHLCGDFTVADIAVFLAVGFGAALGVPADPALEKLGAWFGRVHARPAVGSEYDAMMTRAASV